MRHLLSQGSHVSSAVSLDVSRVYLVVIVPENNGRLQKLSRIAKELHT